MEITLEAIAELEYKTVVIYPNTDAGSHAMINVIDKFVDKYDFIKAYKTLPRDIFVNLQRKASVLVGNSSCGLLEAPFLKLPVVNVGNRQKQRQHAENIIFVPYEKEKIQSAIKTAIYDEDFIKRCRNCSNPYGDGYTSARIARIISETKIDDRLINKQITY